MEEVVLPDLLEQRVDDNVDFGTRTQRRVRTMRLESVQFRSCRKLVMFEDDCERVFSFTKGSPKLFDRVGSLVLIVRRPWRMNVEIRTTPTGSDFYRCLCKSGAKVLDARAALSRRSRHDRESRLIRTSR
jgi:hypothetical protein